jgi:hypothetical protein
VVSSLGVGRGDQSRITVKNSMLHTALHMVSGDCEHGNKPSGSIKLAERLSASREELYSTELVIESVRIKFVERLVI